MAGVCVALVLLVCCLQEAHTYKVLLLPPPVHRGSYDHLDHMLKLGETLAERRNQVTMVVQGDTSITSSSVTMEAVRGHDSAAYLDLDTLLAKVQTEGMAGVVNSGERQQASEMIMKECEELLANKKLRQTLQEENFHIAVTDHVHTCGYLFAAMLGLPYAVLDTSPYLSLLSETGAPHPLAYVPTFHSGFTDRMSFLDRVSNWWQYRSTSYTLGTLMNQPYVELQRRHNIATEKSMLQLRQTAEVFLINSDSCLDFPRPLMPNTIQVGGMLTKPPAKLPQDIEEFMNESDKSGVVIVTFGKEIDLQFLPKLFDALVAGFKMISQRVLWQSTYRAGQLPINVKIVRDLPLNDVLGHANTKVLVTAGDTATVFEAIYHAVPMLVIPVGADSYDNGVRVGARGMGIIGELQYFSPEKLANSVKDLSEGGQFKSAMLRSSSVLKDQLVHPATRAAFWVEHVVRQGGGEHMRSTSMYFSDNQLLMIDVTIFALFLYAIFFLVVGLGARFAYRKLQPYYELYQQRKLDNKSV